MILGACAPSSPVEGEPPQASEQPAENRLVRAPNEPELEPPPAEEKAEPIEPAPALPVRVELPEKASSLATIGGWNCAEIGDRRSQLWCWGTGPSLEGSEPLAPHRLELVKGRVRGGVGVGRLGSLYLEASGQLCVLNINGALSCGELDESRTTLTVHSRRSDVRSAAVLPDASCELMWAHSTRKGLRCEFADGRARVELPELRTFTQIAADPATARLCALDGKGKVYCGRGASALGEALEGEPLAREVEALSSRCLLNATGEVACIDAEGSLSPQPLPPVSAIASSRDELCGLTKEGAVHCVGPGRSEGAVLDLPPTRSLTAGPEHLCALTEPSEPEEGATALPAEVWCWGLLV